jgi:hypothetical protein
MDTSATAVIRRTSSSTSPTRETFPTTARSTPSSRLFVRVFFPATWTFLAGELLLHSTLYCQIINPTATNRSKYQPIRKQSNLRLSDRSVPVCASSYLMFNFKILYQIIHNSVLDDSSCMEFIIKFSTTFLLRVFPFSKLFRTTFRTTSKFNRDMFNLVIFITNVWKLGF